MFYATLVLTYQPTNDMPSRRRSLVRVPFKHFEERDPTLAALVLIRDQLRNEAGPSRHYDVEVTMHDVLP